MGKFRENNIIKSFLCELIIKEKSSNGDFSRVRRRWKKIFIISLNKNSFARV
jgi:hypothetical protein